MRILTILCLLVLSSLAQAQSTTLEIDKITTNWHEYNRPSFAINAELGRAWVEVDVEEVIYDESDSEEIRIKVAGLYFDQTSQNIIFEKDGVQTVCAETYVKRRRFSTTRIIKKTGLCTFSERTKYVEYDNGYEIKKVKKTLLLMVIN